MREIGGYLELEDYPGNEYYSNALALNSGRSCLYYLIRSRELHKLYLPYYLCDSIIDLCRWLQVEVEQYYIDAEFRPVINVKPANHEAVYIVNYYGQLSNLELMQLVDYYSGRVIIDNAQAFFQASIPHVDTLYTCRKYFGVPDGGYLYTDAIIDDNLEQEISANKVSHILGRYEKSASEFYDKFVLGEEQFNQTPIRRMSKLTHNLLRPIDYERAATRRTNNFTYQHDKLKKMNKLQLVIPQGAFMYPLYLQDGAEIRSILQKQRIYIPILWPNVLYSCPTDTLEYKLAQNILPLPCDQRYTTLDMEYILSEVMKCID